MLPLNRPCWPKFEPSLICLVLFLCVGFADGMIVPFFPLWARSDAGIPVGFIGLLFGCYAGGELIAAPFLGGIADRIGRRPVLIASSFGVGIGFTALYFAHGVIEAAAVLLAIGMCESVLHPTISSVMLDTTPIEDHRRQFSLVKVSSSVGRVLGPAAGSALVQVSLAGVFIAAGAAMLVGGALLLLCLPETRHPGGAKGAEEEEMGLGSLLPALRDRSLATLLTWFMLLEVAGSWIEAALPLYAHDAAAMSATGVGLLFTYAASLIAIAQLPLTRIAERRSAISLILVAGGSLICAFAILAVSPAVEAMIAAVTLFSLSQMLTGPLVPTAVNQLAPPSLRATYMAATSVTSDMRDSVGPATGTALYAASSLLPWLIGIPLAGLAAVGLGMSIVRQQRPPTPPSAGTPTKTKAAAGKRVESVRICGFR